MTKRLPKLRCTVGFLSLTPSVECQDPDIALRVCLRLMWKKSQVEEYVLVGNGVAAPDFTKATTMTHAN